MNRSISTLLFAIFVVPQFASAAPSQGLLDDGEFNNPDASSDVTNSDWTLTTNRPDGTELASRFQFSGFSRSDGAGGTGSGLWLRSFEGNQGGMGDPLAQSDLMQSIEAPISGNYQLSVDWARETNFTADSWDVTLSSSGTGGSASVDLLNAVGNTGPFNFNQLLVTFGGPNVATIRIDNVTAGDTLTVRMAMVNGVDAGENPQSAFIDNFNLRLVPEPASGLVIGIGVLALLGIRRRA